MFVTALVAVDPTPVSAYPAQFELTSMPAVGAASAAAAARQPAHATDRVASARLIVRTQAAARNASLRTRAARGALLGRLGGGLGRRTLGGRLACRRLACQR